MAKEKFDDAQKSAMAKYYLLGVPLSLLKVVFSGSMAAIRKIVRKEVSGSVESEDRVMPGFASLSHVYQALNTTKISSTYDYYVLQALEEKILSSAKIPFGLFREIYLAVMGMDNPHQRLLRDIYDVYIPYGLTSWVNRNFKELLRGKEFRSGSELRNALKAAFYAEILSGEYQISPLDEEDIRIIEVQLLTLTPHEEKVIRMRYGLGGERQSLEEIGAHFNVTRERIRQVEAKTLRKLRHPSRSRYLKNFQNMQIRLTALSDRTKSFEDKLRTTDENLDQVSRRLEVTEQALRQLPFAKELAGLPEDSPKPVDPILDRSVDELEFSVRTYNCLDRAGIKTVRDLVQRSDREMLAVKNFGKKCLREIKEILKEMHLDLGMVLDEQGMVKKDRTEPPS